MATQIQLRRDTAANWTTTNPVLAQGEPGLETDTGKLKFGDGTTAWSSLAYQAAANIVDGTIVNADVSASAAIAGTKISPDFGSQNIVTTGTDTAASYNPTSSTVPTNGLYLPAANSLALATGGSGRLFVDSSGGIGVNTNTSSISSIGRLVLQNASTSTTERFVIASSDYLSGPTYEATYLEYSGSAATGTFFGISNAKLGKLIFQNTNAGLIGCNGGVPLIFGTSGIERLRITSTGTLNFVGAGTAGTTQAVSFNGSAPVNSLVIDSSGRLGVGVSSPFTTLHSYKSITGGSPATTGTTDANVFARFQGGSVVLDIGGTTGGLQWIQSRDVNSFATNYGLGLCPNGGNVGIGDNGPDSTLTIKAAASTTPLRVSGPSSEFCRVDSSGRLLLGTSSSSNVNIATFQGNSSLSTGTGIVNIALGNTSPGTTDQLGRLQFTDSGHNSAAEIVGQRDGGTWNTSTSRPTRLVFSTTPDGTASPVERLRIDNAGMVTIPGKVKLTGPEATQLELALGGQTWQVNSQSNGNFYIFDSTNSKFPLTISKASPSSILIANDYLQFGTGALERARLDSSGRLLVGTSTSIAGAYSGNSRFQSIATSGAPYYAGGFYAYHNDNNPCVVQLGHSRNSSVGHAVLQSNDGISTLRFEGSDGTSFIEAASIGGFVDGGSVTTTAGSFVVGRRYKIATVGTTDFTLIGASANTVGVIFAATGVGTGTGTATNEPYTNSMPGRLVFNTTANNASSPTEQLRITNDGVLAYNQAAPVAVDTTATLTVANLKTGIITSTTAAAVTMTLPTGTLTEGGFSSVYTNMTFEWTVINTGATNAVTVAAGTAHTLVGSGTVAAGVSGRFASRRTAANTFVTYRLS